MLDIIIAQADDGYGYGSASFFGMMGVTLSIVFASKPPSLIHADTGAAIGTAYSGIGIASLGILRPDVVVKSIVPVVMAGILGIYGLIVSVILIQKSKLLSSLVDDKMDLQTGFKFFASGLACGLSGLVSLLAQPGCWLCYWVCRRCRSEGQRTTTPNFRGDDPHAHLRRSYWPLRAHRRHHSEPRLIH